MPAALELVVDHAQKRLKRKPMSTLVDGETWDRTLGDGGCVIEPIYFSAILRPRCWEGDWYDSLAAPYDKLSKASYDGLTSDAWEEIDRTGTGGSRYLCSVKSDGYGETAITKTTYGENRGFYVGWFPYGDGSDYITLKCGWSNTGDSSAGVALHFWANGRVDVYKAGELVGEGNVTGAARGRVAVNELIEVVLLPWRIRELLIISSQGEGFSHVFEDIDPDSPTAITPDEQFWWQVPAPGEANVQCAPLKFATSGTIYGLASEFKRAPEATAAASTFTNAEFPAVTNAQIYGHNCPGGGLTAALRNPADSAAFVADGTARGQRIKLTLTGGGSYTPTIYGARMAYSAETANTPNSTTDLMPFVRELSLNVPADPGDVDMSIEVRDPAAIEAEGAYGLRSISNRPIRARLGAHIFLDGRSEGHEWTESTTPETRMMRLRARDAWKLLERTIFDDPIPLDGLTLSQALVLCLRYVGFSGSEIQVEDVPLTLDSLPRQPGDWNTLIRAGDSVAYWVRNLIDEYASSWYYGFRPRDTGSAVEISFFAGSPSFVGGDTPKKVLWPTTQEAVDYLLGLGRTEEEASLEARHYVYNAFDEATLEPEANEIYLTGIDVAQRRPIVRAVRDEDSIDPTVPVADRVGHWQGEVVTVGIYNPSLSTDELLDEAVAILEPRLTQFRRLPNWECQFLTYEVSGREIPLWRGDIVRLMGVAGFEYAEYRIEAFDGDFAREEGADEWRALRPFRYSGEEIYTHVEEA